MKKFMNLAICTAFAMMLLLSVNTMTSSAHGHESDHHENHSHGTCDISGSHVCDTIKTPCIKDVNNCTNGIEIKWDAVQNATGYQIYRKCGSNSYTKIATVKDCCSYKDTNITAGKTYTYKIRCYEKCNNGNANGKCSKTHSMHHMACPKNTACENSKSGIKICWSKENGVTGYKIYRKCTGESTYKCVKTTTSCKWTDTTCVNGKTYSYKIRCYYKDKNGKITYSVCCKAKELKCKK